MGVFLLSAFDLTSDTVKIGKFVVRTEKINNFFWTIAALIIIAVCMYLIIKVGNAIIDKTVKKQSSLRFSLDEKKAKTLGAILSSILRYMVYFFGIAAMLTKLFGGISITLASIGGVAIGFGAQSLIKDVINGFFILFEDQFSVGDYITIEGKSGIVESMELRITKVRDFSGDLHIIPNGLITKVTNHSRGNMRVIVDIDITYEQNSDAAMEVLKLACEEFKKINENLVEGPNVSGITALKDSGVSIRVVGKAKSMTQWECENQLRGYLKKRLDEEGIEIAYPAIKVIDYSKEKEL